MDIGERTATLEAQMEARKEADKEVRGAIEKLSKRIDRLTGGMWTLIALVIANLVSRLVPGIDKVLP